MLSKGRKTLLYGSENVAIWIGKRCYIDAVMLDIKGFQYI